MNTFLNTLDTGKIVPLVEDEVRILEGWLGQNYDINIRMRLLDPIERRPAADYATATDPNNPIILVEIPDIDGNFEETSTDPQQLMSLQPKGLRVMQSTAV